MILENALKEHAGVLFPQEGWEEIYVFLFFDSYI